MDAYTTLKIYNDPQHCTNDWSYCLPLHIIEILYAHKKIALCYA